MVAQLHISIGNVSQMAVLMDLNAFLEQILDIHAVCCLQNSYQIVFAFPFAICPFYLG